MSLNQHISLGDSSAHMKRKGMCSSLPHFDLQEELVTSSGSQQAKSATWNHQVLQETVHFANKAAPAGH
jgi:hypothetical protein